MSDSRGFMHCWKCGETLACADSNGVPVVALTVEVSLCDACAGELAEITEDAAPTVEDLKVWRMREDMIPPFEAPRLGMIVRDVATGEVLAALGTAATASRGGKAP